jgi:transcriptional regulator with XRE-family HTH domain
MGNAEHVPEGFHAAGGLDGECESLFHRKPNYLCIYVSASHSFLELESRLQQGGHMTKEIGHALQKARIALGLSQADVADKLGVSRAAVGQWERGDTAPSTGRLLAVCRLLGLDVSEITKREVYFSHTPPGAIGNEREIVGIHDARREAFDANYGKEGDAEDDYRNLIPVFGLEYVSDFGDFTIEDKPSELARRPESLARASSAYAVYVGSHSLSPRYEIGEMICLAPSRPAMIGDFVSVQTDQKDAGGRPFWRLGRLISRSATGITLEQFSPPRRIEMQGSEVKGMHRILSVRDLLD